MEDLEKREIIQQYTNINTGTYIRIGKENILLENLDLDDREEWLNTLEKDGLERCINILINTLNTQTQYIADCIDPSAFEEMKQQIKERDEEDEE